MADSLSHSLLSVRIPPPPTPHTPLRSPKRKPQILSNDQDPLLAGLSPEAILDALAAINAVPKHERHAKDILVQSMSQVSPDDRAIGARAAIAAQKLKGWLRELQEWPWQTGKSVPIGKGFIPPTDFLNNQDYYGSLPLPLVSKYEIRIEEIRNGVDNLKIEELKEHIISVHVPGRSRPSSANSSMSSISAPPFTYMQLSDFATVITATILRALPTLARLNRLLGTWKVRLLVVRQVPSLLESIDIARTALDSALQSLERTDEEEYISISVVHSKKEKLGQSIAMAGLRMDMILDALETCEDSLPEAWIDRMDSLEADFIDWAQNAERLAFEREWRRSELPKDPQGQQESKETVTLAVAEENPEIPCPDKSGDGLEGNDRNESTITSTENFITISTHMKNQSDVLTKATITPILEDPDNYLVPTKELATKSPPKDLIIMKDPKESVSITTDETMTQSTASSTQDTNKSANPIPESSGAISTSVEESTESCLRLNSEVSLQPEQSDGQTSIDDAKATQNTALNITDCQVTDFGANKATNAQVTLQSEPLDRVPELTTFDISEISPMPVADVPTPKTSVDVHSTALHLAMENEAGTQSQLALLDTTNQVISSSTVPLHSELQLLPFVPHDGISAESESKKHEDVSNEVILDIDRDAPTPKSPIDISTPRLAQSNNSHPGIAVSEVIENFTGYSSDESNSKSPSNTTSDQPILDPPSNHTMLVNRDEPIQSIELAENHFFGNDVSQNTEDIKLSRSKSPSIEPKKPFLTLHSSPGLVSNDSDRTLREKLSPKLDDSMLQKLQIYQHNNNASLPLQRFIDDESDASYSADDSYRHNAFSTPGRLSDIPQYLNKDIKDSPFRNDSESPPPEAVPRRALRGPSSSVMRGTISSLNKVVGSDKRHQSDSVDTETISSRLHPRYRALSSQNAHVSKPVSLNRKSSNTSLLTPRTHLHNQPSMESIDSFVSGSDMGETSRRKFSFSTDGGSFAMRPVNETDNDLHEKIHSILTGIPGQIRLSNNPTTDLDQQSVVSSISTSMKSRLGSRSPFSTPSRAGTPTPSGSFTPTSRPRRATSHKSEDKTVRVYHLHHRGKPQPTKLFVRTVGEDGERVMVRVGGGWADLREYLREYVIHHSRQTPSKSQVEVKGLPTLSTSPGSPMPLSNENTPSVPRPTSVMSNRPGSSLSVRKTRQPSKPTELPALTAENIDIAADNLPLPTFPSARRSSVSSINSVSMSSILGDGSSVYSPHPGSARTHHSQSTTPLGLAGPNPRTRLVSMTPESEAWVENVVGQARRTSSNVKQTPKQTDPRLDREQHSSSRMSIRSVSDIGAAGRNKRVMLKGLGAHEQS
ncbi:hypothetical protein BGW36DRAFT_360836 [Talaromyces proteolyticus]|uniref:GAR domain-containing protein n=1 Tax=Talaromyces proteolyticus TaxID=1131652 RepID=A0AAD4PYW4_9EURO|nr:uncharacterized protein BGW36DRAFT_360836 [Talaromyces proteolyticus]KAH8695127.1 hypothetical protein BGW36DRAFT_360836 [Talaromyces proteolyticus]